MPESLPPEEPQEKSTSFLPIVIFLCVFFLLVLVISILILPDHGRMLLKLAEANPVTHSVLSAVTSDSLYA